MDKALSLNTCLVRPEELVIGLGYCGPTDCCLTLSSDTQTKQFGIESHSWNVCCSVLDSENNGFAPLRIDKTSKRYNELRTLLEIDTHSDEFYGDEK